MLKISLITLAVIVVLAGLGIAWARHNGYCAGGDHLNRVTALVARKLDLNDEQNQRLQGLAETLRKLRRDWTEHRNEHADEIGRLLTAPTLDRNRVMGMLTEGREALAEHSEEVIGAFADFSDSLQPDQRVQLAEFIAKRMQHRWGPSHWAH